jgi:hypothetical protein
LGVSCGVYAVRLSPKYVFSGIVAFGLPFAVTMGWLLGTPVERPPVASAPGGAGGIGAAPERVVTAQPVTPADYASQPPRPGAPASPALTTPATTAPSITASPAASGSPSSAPPPVLNMPPVPTPTEIFDPPPNPSPTPSESAPTEEPGPTGVAGEQ